MRDARTAILPFLLALAPAAARADPPDGGAPRIEVRSGRVASVDWGDRRVTLLAAGGRHEMGFDRNTVVYLPGRLGTMRDVSPGLEVRAAANPDGVAAWIEIRPAADGGAVPADGGAPADGGGRPADGGPLDGGTGR